MTIFDLPMPYLKVTDWNLNTNNCNILLFDSKWNALYLKKMIKLQSISFKTNYYTCTIQSNRFTRNLNWKFLKTVPNVAYFSYSYFTKRDVLLLICARFYVLVTMDVIVYCNLCLDFENTYVFSHHHHPSSATAEPGAVMLFSHITIPSTSENINKIIGFPVDVKKILLGRYRHASWPWTYMNTPPCLQVHEVVIEWERKKHKFGNIVENAWLFLSLRAVHQFIGVWGQERRHGWRLGGLPL